MKEYEKDDDSYFSTSIASNGFVNGCTIRMVRPTTSLPGAVGICPDAYFDREWWHAVKAGGRYNHGMHSSGEEGLTEMTKFQGNQMVGRNGGRGMQEDERWEKSKTLLDMGLGMSLGR